MSAVQVGGSDAGPRAVTDKRGRVERLAAEGPRPLRMLFEAELGYRAWRDQLRAQWSTERAVGPDGTVQRRSRLSPAAQARLAHRLLRVTAALGAVGLITSANLRTGGDPLLVDRLGGRPAATEALAAPAAGAPAAEGGAVTTTGPPATGGTAQTTSAPPATWAVASPPPADAPPAPPADQAAQGPTVPAQRGALPVGKGMWIWLADQVEGGNPESIVARAQSVGLTHLYVRTSSLADGFYAGPFLDRLLPIAHAAGIRVYAWDFPYLDNVDGDVARAVQSITYVTPDGHRVDGYAADIELPSMGVNLTPATARHFGSALRRQVGPNYPIIAVVPRPNPSLTRYPFAEVVESFDAIAPMVYWLHGDPMETMAGAIRDLSGFGKPVLPIGQAYDAGAEGGPRGVPSREALIRFMQKGDELGAPGVSWWSWQHADQEAWDAIRDAAEFRLPAGDGTQFTPGQVKAYQTLLSSLGFPVAVDGQWTPATVEAVSNYQRAARLPITGIIDHITRAILLTPFAPPVQPQG